MIRDRDKTICESIRLLSENFVPAFSRFQFLWKAEILSVNLIRGISDSFITVQDKKW